MATERRSGAPTIRDVARLTKVSAQTVSRVLNTPDLVQPETRERVLAGIQMLGYRRSSIARSLATNRSGAVGVLDSGSSVMSQVVLLSRVESAARNHGFSPRVAAVTDATAVALEAGLETLRNELVEGLIVLGNTTLHVRSAVSAATQVPVVLVASDETPGTRMSTIAVDQAGGARAMIEHLKRRGPRLGHIAGPAGWLDADARLVAWQQNAPRPGEQLLRRGDWSARSGYEAMHSLLDEGVDSVFVSNDYMALGALRACRERDVRVPDDVAVGGYDDVVGADYFQPALTTVRQPLAELGEASVAMLAELIAGQPSRQALLPAHLVVRDSG